MRRSEAAAVVAFALTSLAAGAAWLVGAYGLLALGVALLVAALFIFDVEG